MHSESETPSAFGRYRMVRPIGQGGMAEVYLAEMVGVAGFRKRVAIKRLLPHYASNERFVRMLEDEARIAAAIRHPHVAEVLDFGSVDGQHFIAMEYIEGIDLATVLRDFRLRDQLLPVPAALYIGRCVAEGLHAAHQLKDSQGRPQEVIHRDVSPHNILISYEGAVKLIDFGVAKATNNSTKTKSGVIKGKLQYMSPEQAQAKGLDGRADIFSLGMTLYKMLTGRLPFTGQNEYQVYDQILRKNPVPPRQLVPDLTERIDAIVLKALRKNRDRRFQTAQEMADLIDVALGEVDPDYGPLELGELLAGDMPQPSNADALYEEDFIASVSALDVPPGVDDRAIDRLTDVKSVIKHKPVSAPLPPLVVAGGPDDVFGADASDTGPLDVMDAPAPTVASPVVMSSKDVVVPARPVVVGPVARPVPVAVPVTVPDPPSMDGVTGSLDVTRALPRAGALAVDTPTQALPQQRGALDALDGATNPEGVVLAPLVPKATGQHSIIVPVSSSRPWLLIAAAATLVIGLVVALVVVLSGDAPLEEDEPPAVIKMGTGLPPTVQPDPSDAGE